MTTPQEDILRAAMALMTPEELAATIDVRTSTLATWRYKKIGPAYVKLGKKVFYRRGDVESWIVTRAVTSSVEEVTGEVTPQLELAV